MGFLNGARRSATVVADEPSILVEFADLEGLEPELGRRLTADIARVLAQRLAVANRGVAETPVVGSVRRQGAGVPQRPAENPGVLRKVS